MGLLIGIGVGTLSLGTYILAAYILSCSDDGGDFKAAGTFLGGLESIIIGFLLLQLYGGNQ